MESINRPELVREHNLNLVRKTLFQMRQATRQQLSAETEISTVTMGSLLQQLMQNGEAMESDLLAQASGRPARVYSFPARRKLGLLVFAVFEEQKILLRSVFIDLYGEIVWEEVSPASCMDGEQTLAFFYRLLRLYGNVGAVVLGLPGVGFGEYFYRNRSQEFFSLSALEELKTQTGIPFLVENDVNLAALGFARRNKLPDTETLVYLYLMKGSYGGCGVYLDGKLHLGKNRFAGEMVSITSGTDWSKMQAAPRKELISGLLNTTLPYLTILAPHQLVVASDYILPEHLSAAAAQADALLEGHCPRFLLVESFYQDYQEGLRQMALESILRRVLAGDPTIVPEEREER